MRVVFSLLLLCALCESLKTNSRLKPRAFGSYKSFSSLGVSTLTALQCTTVRREDIEAVREGGGGGGKKPQPQRFIHPQVYKMFHRAQFLIKNGDNVVAQRLLYRCLELNPFDSHSWLALGRLEAKLGNVERSREVFSQSLSRCPNNVHLLHAWGHMEQKFGNEALARDCWSQAMTLDPLNPYVCHALSTLEKRLRNYERAREVLELVVKEKPTSALCASLAELERQLGDPEKSKRTLLHGLSTCYTERSKLLLALAWLEEDAFENTTEAQKLIEDAMMIDKNNVRVHVAKANMELRSGHVGQARKTLRLATLLDADDGHHYTMWATLEIDEGNYREARRVLEEGAAKYPGDQFLLQRWGALEAKHGSITLARELFERSALSHPHAPTFVAWAILEEEQGMQALHPTPVAVLEASSADVDIDNSNNDNDNVVNQHADNEDFGVPPETPANPNNQLLRDSPLDMNIIINSLSNPAVVNFHAHTTATGETVVRPVTASSKAASTAAAGAVAAAKTFTPLGEVPAPPLDPTAASESFASAQFQKARQLFGIGMIIDPQHGPLYHAYGNMEMRRGNLTGAREVFTRGIAMNCSDISSLYHAWGLLEVRDGRSAEACDIFRRGIELGLKGNKEVENGVGFLLHSLGMLEMDNRRIEEARRVFSTGVSLFPSHSQMLLGLALCYLKLGDYEKARKTFRLSIDADPTHAHAWQSWAIAEKEAGNIELARILFRQGLKHCPRHGALWQAFGVMEMHQNNFDVARTLFAQSLKRCPDHAQSYQAWACLEVRSSNFEKAKALVLQGLRRVPSHPALWTVAGMVEDKMGEVSRARKILETALERFPKHGALYKVLGEIEMRQGSGTRAREVFALGLKRDPYCASLYHGAALLEARLGNLEGLSELHHQAKANFESLVKSASSTPEHDDVIERIRQLEVAAQEYARSGTGPKFDDPSLAYVNETFIFGLNQ